MRAPSRPAPVLLAAALLMSAAPLHGQDPMSWEEMQGELENRPIPGDAARVAYGPEADQYGLLRVPEGPGPFPVAVVIHGGCWLSIADHRYMEPLARTLNEAGWATWSLEFRRIDMPGGAWPGILRDVAAGVDRLRVVARDRPLDLNRVVALGHSSGGHLALWAGLREGLDGESARAAGLASADPLPLRGVVGLAPVADLDDYRRYSRCGPTIVTDFLTPGAVAGDGTVPADGLGPLADESARQDLSDPARRLPSDIPQLLLLGELDEVVPPDHGRAYVDRAAAAGQPVQMRVIPGAGHFELVAPWTRGWRDLAPVLLGWMEERIRPH